MQTTAKKETTFDGVLNEVRSVVHHNGEQNYHGGKEYQLNFNENIEACLYVWDFSVGGIKLKNSKYEQSE